MAYCTVSNLLLGNVPTPASASTYVDDAADEMDSLLGARYVTPIVLDENIPSQRSGFLLLKRINSHLASGRLLMALDAAGEDDQVHQYAEYLIRQALQALQMIIDGSFPLPGADPINPDAPSSTGPQATWGDEESLVEAYDAEFGNPAKAALTGHATLPFFGSQSPYTW